MSILLNCAVCCSLLSVWAFIQIFLMGIFYKIEAASLFEDVEPHEYEDYDDFIKKTKHNYAMVSRNCFIVACMYLLMLGISCLCLRKARENQLLAEEKLHDDELSCVPHSPKPNEEKEKF